MFEPVKKFHFALKDKQLHFVLYASMVVLGGLALYYRNHPIFIDQYQADFLQRIGDFELERSLQRIPEVVQPGAIRVPILIYHSVRPHSRDDSPAQLFYDVDPDRFEDQLRFLKENGYVVISLEYLVESLSDNITLPPKPVVLTFDDGWRNQFSFAFPLLHEYGDTATFFIVSDYVGGGSFMNWDQIRYLDANGMTIGSHTRTHPYIPSIHDSDRLWDEISTSKRILEDHLGHKVDLFAYPYGHYTEEAIQTIKNAGYTSARSTYSGMYHTAKDIYTLKGIEISDDMNAFVDALTK